MKTIQLTTPRVTVGQYLEVLGSVAHLLPFGAPEALLPQRRDEIRQAIREVARQFNDRPSEPGMDMDSLRTAYQSLASFVSYEEANIAAGLQHALERNNFAFLASPEAESARQLSRKIEVEAALMAREFDTWCGALSDPLLTEASNVLIEFSRKQAATPR